MMEQYVGTEIIEAEVMSRGDYNKYRGWDIPENENPEDVGYLVSYPGNYETWLLASVFDEIYHYANKMTFGQAIDLVKLGYKVKRKGWNGQNQYIQLATNISYKTRQGDIVNCEHECFGNKAVAFVGSQGVQLGWCASQADLLSEDWEIVGFE